MAMDTGKASNEGRVTPACPARHALARLAVSRAKDASRTREIAHAIKPRPCAIPCA